MNTAEHRLSAVQRLLPIGPDASLTDIIAFRQRNEASLKGFRSYVTELSLTPTDDDINHRTFEARLRTAEQHRDELVRQLKEIQRGRPALDISMSVASFAAPIFEQSRYSAVVAGVSLSYVILGNVDRHLQKRRIMKDRLVYAALAKQEFSPGEGDDIVR